MEVKLEKRLIGILGAHVIAQAVKRLYPNTKLGIGPAIDNGFYYDFKVEKPFSEEDLKKIEEEAKKNYKRRFAGRKIFASKRRSYKINERTKRRL